MDDEIKRIQEALSKANVSEIMVQRLLRHLFSAGPCQAGCEAGCNQCCETGTASRFAAATEL